MPIQDPTQLINDWKEVELDPRFKKLAPDKQSEMRHFYVDNVVLQHPGIKSMLQNDPSFGPQLMQSFFGAEQAQHDEASATANRRITAQPMSQGLGIRGSQDMQPGIKRGLTRVAEDLTSLENLGLLVGTAGMGTAITGGAKVLGVAAPTAARIARGAEAATSAGFAYQMGKGTYQGLEQLDQLSEAINQARNQNASPEELEKLEAFRREAATEMAVGGLFALGAGRHAIRGGRAAITGRPEPQLAARLQGLGYKPEDFVNRLDLADHVVRNQIPASRFKKPESAPVSTGGTSTAYVEPTPAPEPVQAAAPALTPTEVPEAPPAPPQPPQPGTAAIGRLADAMKIKPNRISLQKPPDIDGVEVQISGRPSGDSIRSAAQFLTDQGAEIGKQRKNGFDFTKDGKTHRVRLIGYEGKQSSVTPVTEVPPTNVAESAPMDSVAPATTVAPGAPAAVGGPEPTTAEHPLTAEFKETQSKIDQYLEALRAKGREPENLLRSDAADVLRSQGEEVGPESVVPAPLEALMNHADALRNEIDHRGIANGGEPPDVTRRNLALMREKVAERQKLTVEHNRALKYVEKENDAQLRLLEDKGWNRATVRDQFIKQNGGQYDPLKFRALLREATGENFRGKEGFRGKGYNPKSKDPMKGAEYRDDKRIEWLGNEMDRVQRDIDLINKPTAGAARSRMQRNIEQRAPELNAYSSLQEAAAPQGPVAQPSQEVSPYHPAIDRIIGNTPGIARVKDVINRVRNRNANVLITGETGVGKELVAQALHESSSRAETGDFVPVNVAAIPSSLLESELFGSTKGAFTGADRTRLGLMAQAHKGTLFLDEIGELPPELQTKLLRALQEKKVRPVGGEQEYPVDVRIIAASNKDLSNPANLRPDLYQRLNVVGVHVPPLRERAADIPALAQHFVEQEESGVRITPEAMAKLQGYQWEGNIRELQNAVQHALALREDPGVIDVRDLPDKVQAAKPGRVAPQAPVAARPAAQAPARPAMSMEPPNPAEIATRREKGYKTQAQVNKQLGIKSPMPARKAEPAPAPTEPVQAAPGEDQWAGMDVRETPVQQAKAKLQSMAEQAAKPVARPLRVGDRVSASLPTGEKISATIIQETPKGFKLDAAGRSFVLPAERLTSEGVDSMGAPPGFVHENPTQKARFYELYLATLNKLENHQNVDPEIIAYLQKETGVDLTGEMLFDKDNKPLLDELGNPRVKNISKSMQLKRLQDFMVKLVQADTKVRLEDPDLAMSRDQKVGCVKPGDLVRISRVKAKAAEGRVAEVAPDYVRLDDGTRIPIAQIRGRVDVQKAGASNLDRFETYEAANEALKTHFNGKGKVGVVRNEKTGVIKWYKVLSAEEARPTKPDSSIAVTPLTPEEIAARDNATGATQTIVKETIGTQKEHGAVKAPLWRTSAIPGLSDRTGAKPAEVQAGPERVVTPQEVVRDRTAKLKDELAHEPDPAKRYVLQGKIQTIIEQVRKEFEQKAKQEAAKPRVVTSEKIDQAVQMLHDRGVLKGDQPKHKGKSRRESRAENIRWLRGLNQPNPEVVTKPEPSGPVNPMGGAPNPTKAAPVAASSPSPESADLKWKLAQAKSEELVKLGEPEENVEELVNWLVKLKGKVPKDQIVDVFDRAISASLDAKKRGEKFNHAEAVGVIEDFMRGLRDRGASGAYVKPSATDLVKGESGAFTPGGFFDSLKEWIEKPQVPTGVRRLDEIAAERRQDIEGAHIGVIPAMAKLMESGSENFFDQLLALNTQDKSISAKLIAANHPELRNIRADVEANLGRKLEAHEDPYIVARNIQGGGGGSIYMELYDIAKITKEAQDSGLYNVAVGIADLTGFERGIQTVRDRIARNTEKHDALAAERANVLNEFRQTEKRGLAIKADQLRKQMLDLRTDSSEWQDKLDRNALVPKEYNSQSIAADMAELKRNVSPEQFQQAQDFAQRLWDGNRKILDQTYDEGLVSAKQYAEYVSRGDTYHPLKRIMDNVAADRIKYGAPGLDMRMKQKIFQMFGGSERTTKDPFQTSMAFRQEALREIQRNQVAKTLVNFLQESGRDEAIKEVKEGYKPGPGEGVIGFYEGGNQRYFAVPDFIANTIHMARPADLHAGMGIVLNKVKGVFQKGTTLANLAFAIPNAIRDVQDMALLSKAAPRGSADLGKLFADWGRSLASSLTHDADWQRYMQSNASFSTLQRAITPEHFMNEFHRPVIDPMKGFVKEGFQTLGSALTLQPKATLKHSFGALGKVIRTVEDLNDAFETATKLTAFKRLERMGMEGHARDFEVRNFGGSPDFARRGRQTDLVNLMVMFFNANVQGVARTAERLYQNPKTLRYALVGFGSMALAMHGWNSQQRDANGEPLWNRVPDTDKQNYWILLTGETYNTAQGAEVPRYLKFPKGHVARVIFNPLQESTESLFYSGSANNAYQTSLNILSNLLPGQFNLKKGEMMEDIGRGVLSSANPVLREPLEQASGPGGYDSFRGIPIEPRRLNEVSASEAYVPTTSSSVRKVAGVMQQVPDLERVPVVGPMLTRPMRLQHVIENVGGGVAQQGLQILDAAQGQNKEFNELLQGDESLRHMPVVGNIAGRFVGSPIDAREKQLEEDFYKEFDKAQTLRMTLSKIEKTEPQRVEEYLQDPEQRAYVALFPHLQKVSKELSELRGAQTMITKRGDLSPEQRKAVIRNLYQARLQLLKAANGMVNQVKTNTISPQ